jgi:hypothetical protein
MRYAVYRILYGEDFIQESINSITGYVDKIFIFWTNKVLGEVTQCEYKTEIIKFPSKFDNVISKIKELKNPKVILIEDYVKNNMGQFTHLVNDYILPAYKKPDTIIFIEPDHVFHERQIIKAIQEFSDGNWPKHHASTEMVELWKTPGYRIERLQPHYGSVFWDFRNLNKCPKTQRHANQTQNIPRMNAIVHNFGFCVSDENMFWKHMTALGFSQIIGDSPPREEWYDEVWLAWTPEMKSLEISKRFPYMIPRAVPYDVLKLPRAIRERFKL